MCIVTRAAPCPRCMEHSVHAMGRLSCFSSSVGCTAVLCGGPPAPSPASKHFTHTFSFHCHRLPLPLHFHMLFLLLGMSFWPKLLPLGLFIETFVTKACEFLVLGVIYLISSYTYRLSAKELMLSNCGAGEDSWESLRLQRDQTSQS